MKTVKTICIAAMALASAAAFADGWSIDGYIRGGVEGQYVVTETSGETTVSNQFNVQGVDYNSGYGLGLGDERIRLNFGYAGENVGFKARYQQSTGGSFTDAGTIQYALGYAKLFQNYLQVEAGYLTDSNTATEGDTGFATANKKYGARIVAFPLEGLAVSFVGAANSTTDLTAVYGGAMKYSFNNCNFVAGYASTDNQIYGGVKVNCFSPAAFVAEASYSCDTGAFTADEKLTVSAGIVNAGVISYQKTASSDSELTYSFYPYISANLSDYAFPGLSAGIDVAYETSGNTFKATPELTYKSGAAQVQAYYTFATSKSYTKHMVGLGYKLTF